jgi:hypothetical protein
MTSYTEFDMSGDTFLFIGHDVDGDGQVDGYKVEKDSGDRDGDEVSTITRAGVVEHGDEEYLRLDLDFNGDGETDGYGVTKFVDSASVYLFSENFDPSDWVIFEGAM